MNRFFETFRRIYFNKNVTGLEDVLQSFCIIPLNTLVLFTRFASKNSYIIEKKAGVITGLVMKLCAALPLYKAQSLFGNIPGL